jgi:hypothetical protein
LFIYLNRLKISGKSKCETISKAPDDIDNNNNNDGADDDSDASSDSSGMKINNAVDLSYVEKILQKYKSNKPDSKTSLHAADGQLTSVATVTSQADAADVSGKINTAEVHNGARPKTTLNFGNNFAALKDPVKTALQKPDGKIMKESQKTESQRLDDVHTKVKKNVQIIKEVYPEVNNGNKIPEAPKDIQRADLLAEDENMMDVSMEVEIQDGQEPIIIPHDEVVGEKQPSNYEPLIILDDSPIEVEQRAGPSNTGNKRRGRLAPVFTETVIDDDPYQQLIKSLSEPSTSGKFNVRNSHPGTPVPFQRQRKTKIDSEPKENAVINIDLGFRADDDLGAADEFLLENEVGDIYEDVQQGATADPVLAVKDHVVSGGSVVRNF